MPSSESTKPADYGSFSLNQIDQTCRKAAKGVGLPWGVADDIGKALRWLSAYQLTTIPQIIEVLGVYQPTHYRDTAPRNLTNPLNAKGGRLNPLLTGLVLSDMIDQMVESPIITGELAYPIFTVGFLGQVALTPEDTVRVNWADVSLTFYRDRLAIHGNLDDLNRQFCEALQCERVDYANLEQDQKTVKKPVMGSVNVKMEDWAELEKMAHHTYVEATDESRQSGAGAGLNDND